MMDAAVAIVITEIMYNPASSEKQPVRVEWVEVYNRSERPVDLSGWKLCDEDGESGGIPQGARLPGGETMILIPKAQTPRNFLSGWPLQEHRDSTVIVQLDGWRRGGFGGLSNSPSPSNEMLVLRRANGSTADAVNFDDTEPWPSDSPEGPSIYLRPHAIDPALNDRGENWARSSVEEHGGRAARNRGGYSEKDIGSPGFVAIDRESEASDATLRP
ncbi:lamin tail domain-containing protein [Mucisphaera calidilacus]|uniref:LTD domain-containing protein n=1 Tax=Mucisphaera calidilacus TaxID=2527982 RepID=A0A518BZL2_9BACT|nr:lamin tail domain-containing protein [Mucisphaera calidilacus]QDU72417.1 hypothetical protein Pan265_22820 [Mucisphaera calidilacus]